MSALKARPYEPERKEADFSILGYLRHRLEGGDEGTPEARYVAALNQMKNIEIARIGDYLPGRALGNVRAMNITTDSAGGFLVADEIRPDDFVHALGNVLLANRLGVETWPGLVGNVMVPSGASAAQHYWLGDDGTAPTESPVSFGGAGLKPHTVGALLPPISRNLVLLGARKSTERILQGMLRRAVASGIDTALFAGSGVDGQPSGILVTPGIDSADGTNFSRTKALARLKVLEDENVATENAAWVGPPGVAQALRGREQGAAGYPPFLLNDDNKMCGRPFYVTNAIPPGTLLLGNFPEGVVLPTWGPGPEIIIDDKTRSKEGQVRIVCLASVDIFVRRTACFALSTGVS
ncbi:MAG: phage major capsid protein [Deltaproteobacteria bacterium]|nr:phage major capsid protein [Deltaproteobacteria bacterium]